MGIHPGKGQRWLLQKSSRKYAKRLGDIPPGCIFVHKVRVQEQIDDELDHYKYDYEDGTVGGADCWDYFDFITLVGQSVELTENAPVKLNKLLEPKVP